MHGLHMLRSSIPTLTALALLGGLVSPAFSEVPWSGWGGYVNADVEAWSNGVPVLNLNGRWEKGYRSRMGQQGAYASARAEAGVQLPWLRKSDERAWRIGALSRIDATARLSGGAAQALYHYQSRTDPSAPVTLDASSDILYWAGRGFSVHAPVLESGGFTLDLTFDQLTLSRLRSLQSAGFVTYNANDTYSYAGTLRNDSSRTQALFTLPPASQGRGNALSVALAWHKQADKFVGLSSAPGVPDRVTLRVDDAWSKLRWEGINGDDATVQSDVSELGDARINGQYTRRTLIERIPISAQLNMEWVRPEGLWTVRVKNRLGLWQGWLGWQSTGVVGWRVAAEPMAGAVQLGVNWMGFKATVMTDRLDDGARARGGSLSWAANF